MTKTASKTDDQSLRSLMDELPLDRLKEEAKHGLVSVGDWAVKSVGDRVARVTDKLEGIGSGGPVGKAVKGAAKGGLPGAAKGALVGVKDKVAGVLSRKGGNDGGKATKATNIIEEIDIGAPIDVVYDQWTQFQDFPKFMKKVENVEQKTDEKLDFQAQVLWSHRTWHAMITDQVQDQHIIWRSSGPKGHVDGAVTFHSLAPRLTRVLLVLEYYPRGFMEHTGNLWRAQGRRARLELKHFRRHVMMNLIHQPDQLEGWHGEIHAGEVTVSHEDALEAEQNADEDAPGQDEDVENSASEEEYEEERAEEEPAQQRKRRSS